MVMKKRLEGIVNEESTWRLAGMETRIKIKDLVIWVVEVSGEDLVVVESKARGLGGYGSTEIYFKGTAGELKELLCRVNRNDICRSSVEGEK